MQGRERPYQIAPHPCGFAHNVAQSSYANDASDNHDRHEVAFNMFSPCNLLRVSFVVVATLNAGLWFVARTMLLVAFSLLAD